MQGLGKTWKHYLALDFSKFNAEVECDLMFYRNGHIVCHIIDTCIRLR